MAECSGCDFCNPPYVMVNKLDEWSEERNDVLRRFRQELEKATGDGSKKRQAGTKPPWYEDGDHLRGIFSHLTKYFAGEKFDKDSGAHTLVHCAWRCLAIACRESGNVPTILDSQEDNK